MVFTIRKRAAENSLLLADGGEAVAVFRSDYCSLAVTLAPKTLILTKRGMIRSQLSAARLSPAGLCAGISKKHSLLVFAAL